MKTTNSKIRSAPPTFFDAPCHVLRALFRAAPLVIALSALSGCATPPLSSLRSKYPQPLQVTVSPGGAKRAEYGSRTSDMVDQNTSGGGLIEGVFNLGVRTICTIGGQKTMTEISRKTGDFERAAISKEFEAVFKQAGYSVGDHATATFSLELKWYGLYKERNNQAFARIDAMGSFRNSDGKTVWRRVGRGESPLKYPWESFSENPDLYKTVINSAAENLAQRMLFQSASFGPPITPL